VTRQVQPAGPGSQVLADGAELERVGGDWLLRAGDPVAGAEVRVYEEIAAACLGGVTPPCGASVHLRALTESDDEGHVRVVLPSSP